MASKFKVKDFVRVKGQTDVFEVIEIDESGNPWLKADNGETFPAYADHLEFAQAKAPNKAPKAKQSTTRKYKPESKRSTQPEIIVERSKASKTAKVMVGIVLAAVCVLNMQPWLEFGREVVAQIEVIPFYDLLVKVPYLGGAIEFISPHFWQFLGFSIWAFANASQCGKALIKLFDIRDPWWVSQLTKWSSTEIKAIAYIAEFTLTFLRYPPYTGGYEAVQRDYPNLDVALIDWKNAAMATIVIFAVELTVYYFIKPGKNQQGVKRVKFVG